MSPVSPAAAAGCRLGTDWVTWAVAVTVAMRGEGGGGGERVVQAANEPSRTPPLFTIVKASRSHKSTAMVSVLDAWTAWGILFAGLVWFGARLSIWISLDVAGDIASFFFVNCTQ